MRTIATIAAFRAARPEGASLGLVPTMGYLHAGHIALVERARAENVTVAVSIFVNPTQFGPHEDLARYPRDLDRDLAMLEAAGADLVFVPSVTEMYPQGYSTYIDVEGVTSVLEGTHRAGHFRGVATVVCKLFNIAGSDRAYFGQKDAQQTVVVRQMVRDLDMPTQIVVVPTVREADGLAMSSRNVYLNTAERAAAPMLYRTLQAARTDWDHGEDDARVLRERMLATLATDPLMQVEYVSIADPDTLAEIDRIEHGALVSLAVRLGRTRLIDNIILG